MTESQSERARFLALCKALAGSGFAGFCAGGIFFDQGAPVIAGAIGCGVFLLAMATFNGAQRDRYGSGFWSR